VTTTAQPSSAAEQKQIDPVSHVTAPSGLSAADEAWIVSSVWTRRRAKLLAMIRPFKSPSIFLPAAVFLFIVVMSFFGPLIFNLPSPKKGDLFNNMLGVGAPHHLLGTTDLGYDELSRLVYGGRVSLIVGIFSTGIALVVGSLLGITAGLVGGLVEKVIMRMFDTLLAFPGLVLAAVIADYLGASVFNTAMAISLFGVSRFGRLAWSQTITVRERDFIIAARADGVPLRRIIFGHMAPNVFPTLMSIALFSVGTSMMIESGLSYLGLGVKQGDPTWGNMITDGFKFISVYPRYVIIPSLALLVTVLSINLLGDALRQRAARER
jgi:peptide/nickel transport system permease protein